MPNYEYQCTQDGSKFELWQEVGSSPPPCPTCGAVTKKVFHPTRVIFKGSGFYVTDLRAEKSAGKSGGSDTSSESAPEAAPAAPAATAPAPPAPGSASAPAAPAPASGSKPAASS